MKKISNEKDDTFPSPFCFLESLVEEKTNKFTVPLEPTTTPIIN